MAISSNLSPVRDKVSQGQTECQTVTCIKYNQTENPNIPEAPVNTRALVYCHRDWMLTNQSL